MEDAIKIEPITSSEDGKRNAYTLSCDTKGQRMNYAACLWRQKVIENPKTNIPEDWQSCKTAACSGKCNAMQMRQEELIAGKSLYFVCRDTFRKLADVAKDWGVYFRPSKTAEIKQSTMTDGKQKEVKEAPVFIAKKEVSALDALAHVGTFAEAITAASKDQSEVVISKPVETVIAPVAIPANETPLQMARRLNAMKSK